MIKNIWAKFSYFWFFAMLFIIGLLSGNLKINAEEIGVYAPFSDFGLSGQCSTNGKFNYDIVGLQSPCSGCADTIKWKIGSLDSTISGRAKNFFLFFKHDLEQGKTYDVTINFKNYDLMSNVTASKVYLYSTSTCDSISITNQLLSLMSVSNKATSSQNANKLKLRIYSGELIGNWAVEIRGDNKYITSVSNFGIKSVDLLEVDTSGNNAIINNNTQNTENIINNNNENTQEIINNNNSNTQAIIDSNKVCNYINKDYISYNNKYLNTYGNLVDTAGWGVTSYITLKSNYKLNNIVSPLSGTNSAMCFYDANKDFISCLTSSSYSNISDIPIPDNCNYVRFSIYISTNRPQFEICKNGSQATTDSIDDLDDTMKDDSVDDPSDDFSDMEDLVATNGVITQLISLPITLYTKVLNNINGTCSAQNLGSLYGTNLIIPCIDVDDYLGSTLWNTIDIIISGFFVWYIARKMIKAFNNFSSMKEGDVIGD